ncbi:ABC transporter ATP-binding protein [Alkalibacillus silvisoli]|uniref:ABC transporter domain-containing protein n=1 Tax=Alkalibacillus silvisoli TaxID=392823 RepID=A0ABP3JX87_9BACI
MNSILSTKQLTKRVDEFTLGPINFELEPNTITVIVGNNGAGKSTILKSFLNLVKPNQGEVRLFNQSHTILPLETQQRIAYQPQRLFGCDSFTGEQLTKLFSKWYLKWDHDLFQNTVHAFDIPLNKPYDKLSKGMQQKLNFALNFAKNADLMILDEPTVSMDIPSKQLVMDLLTEWMEREGKTLLITTHQVDEVRKLADYIMVLKDGKLITYREKESFINSFTLYWVQSELPNQQIPGEVSRKTRQIISNNAKETEAFLQREQINWVTSEHLELEETISMMLSRQ